MSVTAVFFKTQAKTVIIKRFASSKQPRTITAMRTQAFPEGFHEKWLPPKPTAVAQIFVQVRPDPLTSHPILLCLKLGTLPLISPHHLHTVVLLRRTQVYGLLSVPAGGCTNQPVQEEGKRSQQPGSHAGPPDQQAARSDGLERLSRPLLPNAGLEE